MLEQYLKDNTSPNLFEVLNINAEPVHRLDDQSREHYREGLACFAVATVPLSAGAILATKAALLSLATPKYETLYSPVQHNLEMQLYWDAGGLCGIIGVGLVALGVSRFLKVDEPENSDITA